ncbi:HDOD domain-containing protein [Thiohalophilus sp.]|uniref:HDOD domain-containing protein n=1 Tax=Thiohalophilus sp. TaxID=3028392 RepID=UPI002ACDE451|nr:HDOD domain-containing protein [Thiohalophilus sp.]MDZ7805298.1 HDOD domain-containing protein [Thiohalophilus sp.]
MADEKTVVRLLLSLDDLDGVGDVGLLDIARSARIEHLYKGEKLSADEHLDRHVYLIEGEVKLLSENKLMGQVSEGTKRAKLSLFRVHTHGLYALSIRDSILLSLDESTYKNYVAQKNEKRDNGIQVEEYIQDDEDSSLIREVDKAFSHKEVDLPSLPEIARRIYKGLDEDDLSVDTVVELLQGDPVIAARVVQVANSSLYGAANIKNIRGAVNLIGFNSIYTIVMSVVLRDLYVPSSDSIRKRMRRFYFHSIRVGAIAHALCDKLDGFDSDYAFLAGLLHDIGVLPLLIQADKREAFETNQSLLETMLQELAPSVGKRLLDRWGFDSELIMVASECENWNRVPASPDYCDVIQVAQLHCALLGGVKLDSPPLNQLPAFERLGLDKIDPLQVVRQAKGEVNELIGLLA